MKCLIVEDELMAVKVLEQHISHLPDWEIAGVHHNAMDAMADLQKQSVDLLLLDIQMPKLSGLGLLRSLRELPPVIITTAYRDHAIEGFELEVVDYLLKPISFERFLKAMQKVYRFTHQKWPPMAPEVAALPAPPPFIYVKHQRAFVKILLQDIVYLESIKNHVRLVTTSETYLPLISISELSEKLSPQRFLRVHRSFIVAISQVASYTATHVHTSVKILPIGRSYKQDVLRILGEYAV